MSKTPPFPVKPETFPDAATCAVRWVRGMDVMQSCLSRWGAFCPHMILYQTTRFCRHPDAVSGVIRRVPNPEA